MTRISFPSFAQHRKTSASSCAPLLQMPTIGTTRNVLHHLDKARLGCNHGQRAPPPDRAWLPARPPLLRAQADKLLMKVFPEPFRSIFLLTAPALSARRLTLFLGGDDV